MTTAAKASGDDYNYATYDIADALFFNARNALYVFTANNGQRDIPDYNGKWGWFNESSTSAPRYIRENYNRDKCTLLEVSQELSCVRVCRDPIDDQFQRGLYEVQNSAKAGPDEGGLYTPVVPICLSFAAHIYLDVLYNVQVCAYRCHKGQSTNITSGRRRMDRA